MEMTSNVIYLTDGAINNAYFEWLCELIGDGCGQKYGYLLRTLHAKNFFWTVPNDDNRAFEGKELRCKFCEENNIFYDYEQFNMAASMLELIIGLAYRCESIMADQRDNWTMPFWFWKILGNVGLDKFTDKTSDGRYESVKINEILDKIIDRTYNRNGIGGLFPLKRGRKNQKKVELWYQMCSYLVENYYMESVIL